ncbi:hypothetical protein [Rhodococcus pyridinivorans]|uniref:hypothetical protein n=1 Tax=Rhodococcus pyridinivorans TaxID=103816 RepID=UPI0019044865|nr:hypothetical protein [Rhodococcus pyridinivorans]QQM54202.1 hypothetical protein JGU70_05690 [Rhodococcus pyridinivorans]
MTTDGDDTRIRGQVAALLSARELILNRGSVDGVQIGMRFAILNRNGVNIKDPETGAVLGTVEVPKTIVKIVRLQGDNLAVGRTFRTVKSVFGAALGGDQVETLSIKKGSSVRAELDPEDSFVQVGDPVVETIGNEYDDLSE